jgi:hypothetical protein
VKEILDTFEDGRVEFLTQIFDRTVDLHRLDKTLDRLSSRERDALRKALGSLYTFDPLNPTGHYILDLTNNRNDVKVLDRLILISNEEGAYRSSMQLADTSQTGAYDCFRNELLNAKQLKKKLVFGVPERGMLEFDFTSCYLRGKCRNSIDGTRYLPSQYQLKSICGALPRAPEPGERRSFHNLRLLLKPYLFTVVQAEQVLQMLGQHPSIQTEALIVLFGKIVDLRHMHGLFVEMDAKQRGDLFSRLGMLNVWSTLTPAGPYEFHLKDLDQHRSAQLILQLNRSEEGSTNMLFNGRKVDPRAWGQDVPTNGTFSLLHAPDGSAWDERMHLCCQTLVGDEMCRPLIRESFNTGDADRDAAKLLAKVATWAKVQQGKAKIVDRLMQGTVGSLLKTEAGYKNRKQILANAESKAHKAKREFKDEDEAATYIQACSRGHIDRGWKQKLGRAALSIQKTFRGHRVREQQKELQQRAAAATRIQAHWRGRSQRAIMQLIDPETLGECAAALDDVTLFAQIPQLTKRRLLSKLQRKHFAVGADLVLQSSRGDAFFIIEEGVVTVWVNNHQVHRMGTMATFGEMALMDSDYSTPATIRAETSVVALRLGRDYFFQTMSSFEEDAALEERPA